jgi:hypothetical protein
MEESMTSYEKPMQKTFVREISIEKLTDAILLDYVQRGFEVVWKEDSIEIWAV